MSLVQADMESADPSLMFSGVGSSIDITSEARDLSEVSLNLSDIDDGDDEDLYSESMAPSDPNTVLISLVSTVQSTLQQSQGNLSAVQDVVSSIAGIDVDLDRKCSTKAVIDLLQENVSFANEGNFKAILTGVDILVKYAVNLLKLKKNPDWRSIKTTNNVFVNKVKPLQGHEAVLSALGYSAFNPGQFEYPTSCQDPDANYVAMVTTDLLILQKELSQFCGQIHVNRSRFLRLLSVSRKTELPSAKTSPPRDTDIHLQRIRAVQPSSSVEKYREPTNRDLKRPASVSRSLLKATRVQSPRKTGQPLSTRVILKPCAMCEGRDGILYCEKCHSARCEACDKRWHSHPKRKMHQTRQLTTKAKREEKLPDEVSECHICGDKKVDFKCLHCEECFCKDCDERCHSNSERRFHERVPIRERVEKHATNISSLINIQLVVTVHFRRAYNMQVPGTSHIISTEEIKEQWLECPGDRNKTIIGCLQLLKGKVNRFHALGLGFGKDHAALMLFQAGFNVDRAEWVLERQIASKKVYQLEDWITRMWEVTYTPENMIKEVTDKHMPHQQEEQVMRRLIMAEKGMDGSSVDVVFALKWEGHDWLDTINATEDSSGDLQEARMLLKRRKETARLQTHGRATPSVGGARPKQHVIQGTNQAPPLQRLSVQSRLPPKPAMSRAEQLQARIDDLLAGDLDVLEKLDDVKSRFDHARSVDIEAQLMKDEKLLRFRHQILLNEMEDLKTQLEDLGERHQIQRETYNQQPTNYQDRYQPSGDRPLPLPPRRRVRKWKCEHCTFMNEDVSNNVCVVCSETTADPQILVEELEQPVMVTEEVPLRATAQPHQGRPLQVEEEGRVYQYEIDEQKAVRLRKQEKEEMTKQMEEESQKQQQNMSYRLLIMFMEARQHGYSLEDVKTAWEVVESEGRSISPLDWLKKHLEHQLQLIKQDVVKEFCRRYNLEVPEQSDQYIRTDIVHEEWQRNDGSREKTAEACVKRINEKVEAFLQTTDGLIDKAKAVRILLESNFDGEFAKWELQVQAAASTAQEVDNWLGQMWDTTHETEQTIEKIFSSLLPEAEKKDKVRRILMAERGMLWAAVDCVFIIKADGKDWPDSIEAVEACNGDLHRAREYFKECALCFEPLIRSKLIGLTYCHCQLCTECFTGHFSVLAHTTPCMLRYTCPGCDQPDLENLDGTDFQDYFGLLGTMIHEYLSPADSDLYQSKLLNWSLMNEQNFRWCVGCSNGFVLDGLPIKRVQCPHCNNYQCFDCKKPWQDQHQGLTCEQFEAWKRDNDPELQAQGLAAHLKLNGINCPKCKMRYELAKGGCMHFRCPTCRHEFCCGCNQPFVKYPACKKYQSCNGKGLHAHHPRDCLYHLRDEEVAILQQLLQNNGVDYSRRQDAAANAHNAGTCPVNLQLETHEGLEDNLCGKPLEGQSGLCTLHYKEYLVTLINFNNLDPADILTANDLAAALRRNDKQTPVKQGNEADEAYRKRLVGIVKQELPLLQAGGGAAAGPPAAGGQAAAGLPRPGLPDLAEDIVVEDLEELP